MTTQLLHFESESIRLFGESSRHRMPSKSVADKANPLPSAEPSFPPFFRSGNVKGFVTQIPSGLWAISRIPVARNRSKIFRMYLKSIAKLYALSILPRSGYSEERILGARIRVLDYRAFIDVFSEIFVRQDYFFESTSRTPLILDCGSNIGMSVLFFKSLYPDSRIIAFEPDRLTFNVLQMNVQNNFENVEIHNNAISSTEDFVEFYSDPDQPGSLAMSTARERFPGREVNTQKVETIRLSEFIREEVDLLKMDIEGAEESVLKELAETDKLKWVKEMFIEYHHHLNPDEDRLSELFRLFEENGFGCQIHSPFKRPFVRRAFQDIQIYAYRRS
jgi:FkbM family methyltransferase